MSELQELAIDAKCLSYLERVLRSGKSLSHLLLERVDFAAGKIHALLSTKVGERKIKDFAAGGIGSIKSPRRALAEIGIRYLQEPGKHIVIEEGLARPGDPAIRNKEGVILLAGEIYYLARKIDTVEQMERFLMQPRYAIGLVGVFCTAGAGEIQKISETALADFVATTEKVLVGAFDGEGFLLWTANE
jgi:hypothetical protein